MTYEQLIESGKALGLTDECAAEMANEHITRRSDALPGYVASGLNSAIDGQPLGRRLQKWLDRKFGFNSENVHDVWNCGKLHCTVNRGKVTNLWYVA